MGFEDFVLATQYNCKMPFSESSKRAAKAPPPESTHEEANYLKNLVDQRRAVTIKLTDGEAVRGWIGKPNLFIYKDQIAYLAEEGS
jgi:hypothetical protein